MPQSALRLLLHLLLEIGAKLRNLFLHVGAAAAKPQKRGPGLFDLPVPSEPTGCLRKQHHAQRQDDAGNPAQPQHPPPCAIGGEAIADQIGDQDPQSDGKLVERDERAPLPRGGDLGQVEGGQHGCAADADPDEQAPSQEYADVMSKGRDDGTRDEYKGRGDQHRAPAEPVCQRSRDRCPAGRAGERNAGHDPHHHRREMERLAQEQQCAGNHAGVVAEKQTPEGGRRGDEGDMHRHVLGRRSA